MNRVPGAKFEQAGTIWIDIAVLLVSVYDEYTLAIWVAVVITVKIICIFRSRVAIIRVSEIKSAEVRPRVVNELRVRKVEELDFLTQDALVHPVDAVPLQMCFPDLTSDRKPNPQRRPSFQGCV
jgi:hypothetical protein